MGNIPKRSQRLLDGLKEFIDYIDTFYDVKTLTICEIGSWTGSSANLFAKFFKWVYCIDPWQAAKEITTRFNMKEVEAEFDKMRDQHKNISKIKHFSYDIYDSFNDNSFDIVYIDGEHSYKGCKLDIKLYLPKAKLFISGHDYWKGKFDGVIKAVNEVVGKPDKIFSDTSWIKKI